MKIQNYISLQLLSLDTSVSNQAVLAHSIPRRPHAKHKNVPKYHPRGRCLTHSVYFLPKAASAPAFNRDFSPESMFTGRACKQHCHRCEDWSFRSIREDSHINADIPAMRQQCFLLLGLGTRHWSLPPTRRIGQHISGGQRIGQRL